MPPKREKKPTRRPFPNIPSKKPIIAATTKVIINKATKAPEAFTAGLSPEIIGINLTKSLSKFRLTDKATSQVNIAKDSALKPRHIPLITPIMTIPKITKSIQIILLPD